MSSLLRARRHATALRFAVILLALPARGLCLMPEATAAVEADAHACCVKSTETLAPGCCMDGQDDPTASITVRVPTPAPAAATVTPAGDPLRLPSIRNIRFATAPHDSPPPPAILRV